MQSIPQPTPRTASRIEGANMSEERSVFCPAICLVARRVCGICAVQLKDHRRQRWIWGLLLVLASYESYFVRSEERRVGKECRSMGGWYQWNTRGGEDRAEARE